MILQAGKVFFNYSTATVLHSCLCKNSKLVFLPSRCSISLVFEITSHTLIIILDVCRTIATIVSFLFLSLFSSMIHNSL